MKRSVLIIDDTAEDREMVSRALRRDPQVRYSLAEAQTGREGLAALQQSEFDLVFLDYQLADMNAEQFVSKLVGSDQAPSVPIIVLTGSVAVDYSAIGPLEHGVQDFFTKQEVTTEVLARVAKNAIERHRLLRRLVDSERAAEEARIAAERANRAKSHFLTLISHELRTPLTAILGFANLLTENPDDEDAAEMLAMIASSGEHLRDLLNDLIDMAKVEAGAIDVEVVDFDPREVVSATCQLMELRASDNDISLAYDVDAGAPSHLCSDPVRYRQVLLNLLGNAIKFTPAGAVECRVAYDNQTAMLTTWVTDSGPGVAPDIIETLFTPFVQGGRNTKSGHREGIGLGLAISHRLANLMGGELVLESTGPTGTTFRFSVHAPPPEPGADGCDESCEEEQPGNGVPELAGLRILVAEDTPANQYLIKRLLAPTNAQVDFAEDGAAAVRMATATDYDLILMDMLMPVMDGFAATSELKRKGLDTPIVALTAAANAKDSKRCRKVGCVEVITKPILTSQLYSVIGALIRGAGRPRPTGV